MSRRILVVEDQEDNRKIMRDLLEANDFSIIEAVTGEEGVAMAGKEKPDLILMDIQLPGLDGYETTRQIRTNPELKQTPIIAVTSYAMTEDREKAINAGCNGYIEKPINPKTFFKQIQRFVQTDSEGE